METLPIEMVERIVQQLTPQDLARCSAVSRKWREIFNQEWMWKPHCDPELEEPLQNIPCVATPAFVAPEVENSTLSPISRWKLAFMRENRLWKNWRSEEIMNKKEHIIESNDRYVMSIDFLTDTLVVVWYEDQIEILDVSEMPATLVAKKDTLIQMDYDVTTISVCGTAMLLVEKDYSIDVFDVDIMNKSIKLKHKFYLNFRELSSKAKNEFYLYLNEEASKLIIFSLNTGMLLKEEPCPVKNTEKESLYFRKITSSATSDFVAVTFRVVTIGANECCKFYIYNPKELTFLPGPVAERPESWNKYSVNLHGDWLALMDQKPLTLTVYNFQTREVILNYEVNFKFDDMFGISVCYNGFVFCGYDEEISWVKYYSPSERTLSTLYESDKSFEIIDNKFIAIFDENSHVSESVLRLSGQTVEKWDIAVWGGCKINRSFTKVLTVDANDLYEWNDDMIWIVPGSMKAGTWHLGCLW